MNRKSQLRYPAVPLVVHDPYFSIWSFNDTLYGSWAHHWTGSNIGMAGMLRVDGRAFLWSGKLSSVPAMRQTSCRVLPTRTIYEFEEGGVRLTVTFLTPALPHKLDVLSRPVTYLIFRIESLDGKPHDCRVYFDCGGEPCVDQPGDRIVWSRFRHSDFDLLSMASADQRPLGRSGDNLRIDWGRCCFGVPWKFKAETVFEENRLLRGSFAEGGSLPASDSLDMPQRANETWMAMAFAVPAEVPAGGSAEVWAVMAYDDVWSIEYLNRRLPAYWRLKVDGFSGLLKLACAEFETLRAECEAYDEMLMADAAAVGGEEYAEICALAFRQAIGAHKLTADVDGTPLFFSKENFSNGCIATVDVTYPSSPLFLLTAPALLKGMLTPILDYAGSRRWKFPFAPHDLGTYPLANGQVYGGGERTEENQMPVEECGNMLLLAGALVEFSGDLDFAKHYRNTLKLWADYLLEKGYDPENQLCTDDFAGHFAHNANLSLKAILALGAFAMIEEKLGEKDEAGKYRAAAGEAAKRWKKDAYDEAGCYRLAFDRPGSWSQKYNLIWDRLLGLGLFPADIAETELAHYRRMQTRYGLPLDCRKSYTKLDWVVWSATLTGKRDDFEALVVPLRTWIDETPARVPLIDWFETADGGQVSGFQARSVVGGVFIRMMADPELRKKYHGLIGR
ncbi:MAG: DUF4965 domain-containing protein [Lentisphaeria bacterium]|nr:DUF4965 domain-containing protein [Lentisphaeria bacterium]